jgi:chromosome segregation ATPase
VPNYYFISYDRLNFITFFSIDKLKQQGEAIKGQRANLQQQVQQLESQINEIRKKKGVLAARIRNVKTLFDKYRRSEDELNKLKNGRVDVDKERKKNKNEVDKIIDRIAANNINAIKAFGLYSNSVVERYLARSKLKVFDNSTGNIDEQIDALKREILQIQDTCKRATIAYDDLKKRTQSKMKEALELTDGVSPLDSKFKHGKKFAKLPNTTMELQDKIDEMQGRMECIRGVDPQILAEFEERKCQIGEIKQKLSSESERAIELENEIQNLHAMWYPEIVRVVKSINKNFSTFFSKMGFVGEVELTRKEERDYADYGIQIRVQYRDHEKLEALNRHVQSGGERAVAIAVYTLSLQHLTVVPFRCVDEINQGNN